MRLHKAADRLCERLHSRRPQLHPRNAETGSRAIRAWRNERPCASCLAH
nr:MAG TPA: hypothetical protein [Caudoviricetes sp.]